MLAVDEVPEAPARPVQCIDDDFSLGIDEHVRLRQHRPGPHGGEGCGLVFDEPSQGVRGSRSGLGETGQLVDTYARSSFEDTRRKALKYGAMGSTIGATKPAT